MDFAHDLGFSLPKLPLLGTMTLTDRTHEVRDAGNGRRFVYNPAREFVGSFRVVSAGEGRYVLDPADRYSRVGMEWLLTAMACRFEP